MLTAGEITAMQETVDSALPETAVEVQRVTRSPDGAGGQTEVWATIATVAGRRSPESEVSQEPTLGARPAAIKRWQYTLPAGTDVEADDRLVDGGRTFEVRSVDGVRSWELAVIAHCSEIL